MLPSMTATRRFGLVAAAGLVLGCDQDSRANRSDQSATPVVGSGMLSCGVAARPVLGDSGIGRLRLGVSVAEIHRNCEVLADTVRLNNDSEERQRVLLVRLGQDTVAAAIDPEERVMRIFIDRGSIRTRDGLGIGTPLAQIVDRPGVHGGVGESALYITVLPYCGLSFALSEAGDHEHGDNVDVAQLRALPLGTRIDRINVGPCAG
jgi:hypothetical protein